MKTYTMFQQGFIIALGAVFTLASCEKDETTMAKPDLNMNSQVYSPFDRVLAQTYAEWIDEWIKNVPASSCDNTGTADEYAALDESGRVYFLAGATGVSAHRHISIFPDKAILFPVINTIKTFPCDAELGNGPAREQTLEDFLKSEADEVMSKVSSMEVTLDGLPYRLTNYHRIISPVFKIFNNRTLANCFNACAAQDKPQDAVSDGYWIMLKGLEAGDHVLTFKGEVPEYGLISDVTYHIIAR